jgi:tetratricopeptide (TPR) repeat protein
MSPRSALAAVFLFALTPAWAQTQRPPGGQQQRPQVVERKTELRVRVVTENDRPLQTGVLVQLNSSYGGTIAENTTNDRGEVTFYELDPGEYQIVVSSPEVERQQNPVRFSIYSGEFMHVEAVHVKLTASAAAGGRVAKPPESRVSAAELNVPKNARKEFDKGNQLLQKNKAEEARAHFEKAVQIYPQYASAYNNLGVSWMHDHDTAKARDAFEHALAADPNHSNAAMNLARLLFPEHDWARLEGLLQTALVGTPQDAQALAMMTMTEFNLKKYAETVDYARRTHTLPHEKFPIVHFLAAGALLAQNKPDEAMVEYKVFLKEAPQSEYASAAQKELERLQAR